MKRKKGLLMSLVVLALVLSFTVDSFLLPFVNIHGEEVTDEGTYTITVANKALKNASLSTKIYVNGTKLKKKGFYVQGKINGTKDLIYYVPAKLFVKALGGKYKVSGKKATITLDGFKVQFTVGKDGYSASVTQGVGALAPLSFGKSYKKGSIVYVPVRLFALFYERIAGAEVELNESQKKLTFDLGAAEEVITEDATWFLDDRFTKTSSAEITSDIKAAFDAAVTEDNITPVACIATGEIMGTMNYALVCRDADSEGKNKFCLLVITALPTGSAMVSKHVETNFTSNIISGPVMGGWEEPSSVDLDSTKKAVFDKAMEEFVGVDYKPVAILEEQLVAGKNYCILCEAKGVYPGAVTTYSLVYIYADLSGNAEITDIIAFEGVEE